MRLCSKNEKQYSLTPDGLAYIDRLSQEKMIERLQPHIVTAIDVTNDVGQTLLFRRAFQPYINRLGFPLGKVHFDETIQQAAQRELKEKTGLTGLPLQQCGIVYLESKIHGITISKVMYNLFRSAITEPCPTVASHRGESVWLDVDTLKANECMPGFLRMHHLLHAKKELFFAEFSEEQA